MREKITEILRTPHRTLEDTVADVISVLKEEIKKELLTDVELNDVLREVQGHYYDADISVNADHVAIAQAQLQKILKKMELV
jgi:hypothetical protein